MPLDACGTLTRIVRPSLLARAAKAGVAHYRRERDLAGLGLGALGARNLVALLTEAEAACESDRLAHAPSYSPSRHIRLLTGLLAEARQALRPTDLAA